MGLASAPKRNPRLPHNVWIIPILLDLDTSSFLFFLRASERDARLTSHKVQVRGRKKGGEKALSAWTNAMSICFPTSLRFCQDFDACFIMLCGGVRRFHFAQSFLPSVVALGRYLLSRVMALKVCSPQPELPGSSFLWALGGDTPIRKTHGSGLWTQTAAKRRAFSKVAGSYLSVGS